MLKFAHREPAGIKWLQKIILNLFGSIKGRCYFNISPSTTTTTIEKRIENYIKSFGLKKGIPLLKGKNKGNMLMGFKIFLNSNRL
jgi:hypothetical protein